MKRTLRRRDRLQLVAVVAEADDQAARVEAAQSLEEDVDALVTEELAHVDDDRPGLGEELREPVGVSLVRESLFPVARVRRVAPALLEQRGQRLFARLRPELVDVDAGRHLVDVVYGADHLVQHLADVLRADDDGLCARERLSRPSGQVGSAADRVLELRPVHLHDVRDPGRGGDGPAHQRVVREEEIGRQQLAQRGRVRLGVPLALVRRPLGQQLRTKALIAVEDEHREQPAGKLGANNLCRSQVEALRMRLLRHDHDVMPVAAPLAGERPGVDVRARAAQQVAVPEEDPHGTRLLGASSAQAQGSASQEAGFSMLRWPNGA